MDSKYLVELAAQACDDLKGKNITLINIEKVSSLADWILISEGLSDVQVRAIITSVENTLKEKANANPLRKEGVSEGKWALLDYGDIIVNIFQPKEREFYELEAFWSNGDSLEFKRNIDIKC